MTLGEGMGRSERASERHAEEKMKVEESGADECVLGEDRLTSSRPR